MAVKEGRWDCQYCGTIGVLGRHKSCTNCGRSRPAGTRFYLADDAQVVDKALAQKARLGPDWVCSFCGTSNAADKTICGSCTAPRDAESAVQEVKEYAPGEVPTTGDMTFEPARPAAREEADRPARRRLSPLAIIGIVAAAIFLCAGLIVAISLLGSKELTGTVAGFAWQRTIDVEVFGPVTEQDWTVPPDGRILSQRQELHHTDQVLDHYETRERQVSEQVQVGQRTYVCGQRDLGNGFFEDIQCTEPIYETQFRTETYQEPIYLSVPVYQTMFTYEIDKWSFARTEEASGADHSPYWPRADLAQDEREGERRESYMVRFVDEDGQNYEWETPLAVWQAYESGQSVLLKMNISGDLTAVEPAN